MKYDVFISYSSKDATTAQAICHELEDNHIKCWMAPRDIPVGAKYATVITQAIKDCKAVVLVFSERSAISPWVESEINIAFSCRKPIVPYKIDTAELKNYDEFYLMLNNRHWIEAYPDFKTRFSELVSVVSKLVGVTVPQPGPEPTPEPKPVPTPVPVPTPTSTPKPKRDWGKIFRNGVFRKVAFALLVSFVGVLSYAVYQAITVEVVKEEANSPSKNSYKVGDYYNENGKQGVVFWVDSTGKHGKIVSLTESSNYLQWSSDDYEQKLLIGADDKENGANNMAKVKQITGWQSKYPAFKWCADLGEGWYLPAIEELKLFTLNRSVHDAVNQTLASKGKKLANVGDSHWYWSSTEYNYQYSSGRFSAWYVNMYGGDAGYSSKLDGYYVRAVSAF